MQAVSFLIDFVLLLLVLFATAFTLNGWGALSLRLLGFKASATRGTLTVWFGFAVVLGSLETFHLFMPVDWRLTAFMFFVGVVSQCNQVIKRVNDFIIKTRKNLQQNPHVFL
jgi:general stress protein CsbA